MTAVGAFRRAFLNPDLDSASSPVDFDAFSRWESRVLRYQFLWALYSNTAFWDEVHRWAAANKIQHGLYSYTRPNFNPVARIVEFGSTHIMGGQLDKAAGDGERVKSALPIETESDAVRAGLGRLWRDSRFPVEKDIISRNGTALGDIGVKVCDSPDGGRVTLKAVHPGTIRWVRKDPETRRILAYLLEERRYDPMGGKDATPLATARSPGLSCTYNEEAWVEDGRVHYRTYRNGGLFDWRLRPDGTPFGAARDARPEWDVPYGFIPLVLIQHMAVGLPWGLAEANAGVAKILELADVGSNIGDYVRKILNDLTFIAGVRDPGMDVTPAPPDVATGGNPQPGRSKRKVAYLTDPNAKVLHLTQELNIPGVSGHVAMLKADNTEDYPEIDMDLWKTGDPSGRAIRIARQRAESKIQQRRVSYDLELEDVFQMALAIGGLRRYAGYDGLATDEPYSDPVVDLSIAHRPVFSPDPLDDIMEGDAFWTMVGKATAAGVPLEVVLRREGWSDEDIQEIVDAKDGADQKSVDLTQRRMGLAAEPFGDGSGDGSGDGVAPDALFQLDGAGP